MSSLVLKLKQTQQLNQRLQQSLRILQMSGLELEREVEDWLSDNPLLERPETDEFTDSGLNRAVTMPRAGQQLSGDDAEDIWSNIAEEEDFKHYLHAQVCEHPLSQVEAAYVHVLIDFLDEQGYLTDSSKKSSTIRRWNGCWTKKPCKMHWMYCKHLIRPAWRRRI